MRTGDDYVRRHRRVVVRSNERKEQLNNPRNICAFLVYLQINLFIPGRKVASIYFQQFRDTTESGWEQCTGRDQLNDHSIISLDFPWHGTWIFISFTDKI